MPDPQLCLGRNAADLIQLLEANTEALPSHGNQVAEVRGHTGFDAAVGPQKDLGLFGERTKGGFGVRGERRQFRRHFAEELGQRLVACYTQSISQDYLYSVDIGNEQARVSLRLNKTNCNLKSI
jgi:hypothetical protein